MAHHNVIVTDRMIEEGILELYDHNLSEGWEDIIRAVFVTMMFASPQLHLLDLQDTQPRVGQSPRETDLGEAARDA